MNDLLSIKILVGSFGYMPNSFNKFLSQTAWQTHEVAATYSASQVEKVNIDCFFDIQVSEGYVPHEKQIY